MPPEGANVSEESGRWSGGQLPKFPPREQDTVSGERSEKQDRKLWWLLDAVSLIADLITSWL
jgi:hypothetical protein